MRGVASRDPAGRRRMVMGFSESGRAVGRDGAGVTPSGLVSGHAGNNTGLKLRLPAQNQRPVCMIIVRRKPLLAEREPTVHYRLISGQCTACKGWQRRSV